MLANVIRERGPITVAAFMELALYDSRFGYYARAVRRSGRAGDFFTSVDVGPLFGELVEVQLAEMGRILNSQFPRPGCFDLVEAGAGDGRLSADILRAARRADPEFYESVRLHLVEASDAARSVQRETLDDVADRLASSGPSLPDSFGGVLVANELLDAMPVHQVVMREEGLREVYVTVRSAEASRSIADRRQHFDRARAFDGARGFSRADPASRAELTLVEGPLSTPALAEYLARAGVELEPGWRAEINLRAVEWVRDAARRLRRGFIILIDYGHEARELYSASHSAGTLTAFSRHRSAGPESPLPAWLEHPGERDITSHVDFTSIRTAAEEAGLQTLGFLDQTYFLFGLLSALGTDQPISSQQSINNQQSTISNLQSISNQQSAISNLKMLIMPGGLGSTFKVMILGKGVGTPALAGCSYRMRVT